MSNRLIVIFTTAFLLAFGVFSKANADTCEEARRWLDKSIQLADGGELESAYQAVKNSTERCGRFDNWYLQGKIEQSLDQHEAALVSLVEARNRAENDGQSMIALALYAKSLAAQGNPVQAAALARYAKELSASRPKWVDDLAKELDLAAAEAPITREIIVGALDDRAYRSMNINESPAYDVRLNFKVDSIELMDEIRFRPDILASVLSEDQFKDKKITIVGHTDSSGDGNYNLKLSEERAKNIKSYLVKANPNLEFVLQVQGMGEAKLLYPSERDEAERMLNRRIEFKVEKSSDG